MSFLKPVDHTSTLAFCVSRCVSNIHLGQAAGLRSYQEVSRLAPAAAMIFHWCLLYQQQREWATCQTSLWKGPYIQRDTVYSFWAVFKYISKCLCRFSSLEWAHVKSTWHSWCGPVFWPQTATRGRPFRFCWPATFLVKPAHRFNHESLQWMVWLVGDLVEVRFDMMAQIHSLHRALPLLDGSVFCLWGRICRYTWRRGLCVNIDCPLY